MGGKGGDSEAKIARQDEEARQQRIRDGTTQISSLFDGQFNDDYFSGRRKAYVDYASPQLEDQYGEAQKELTYALARGGLLDSSVRADKAGELQQKYDLNKQNIADQAVAHEAEARNAVEGSRADLIATLNATGDAQGAVNSAMSRASALSKPAAFNPLTQLFADFTAGLGANIARERANVAAGAGTGANQSGSATLFGPKTSSMRVT